MNPFYTINSHSPLRGFFKTFLLLLLLEGFGLMAHTQLVFNQIYAGGGTPGARFSVSYVQIINQSNKKTLSFKGMSLQFKAAGSEAWQAIALPDVQIAPDNAYLIAGTPNPAGGASFAADLSNTILSLNETGGTVALVENTELLHGCSTSDKALVELVGWGDATCYVQKPVAASTNTLALYRKSQNSSSSLAGSNFAKFQVAVANPLATIPVETNLPLRLHEFTGAVTPAGNRLEWTATLTGPSTFGIERSENGSDFTGLAIVGADAGAGRQFFYTDQKLIGSMLYYRLRLKDEAGNVSYSAVVKLKSGEQRTTALLYPTIATAQVQLTVNDAPKQNLTYQVISPEGRVVSRGTLPAQQGVRGYTLNVAGLQKGRYFLLLQSGDGQPQTLSFIKG